MTGSILFALVAIELGLRLFWHNPYSGTFASKVVEIRLNAPNLDATLNRAWLEPRDPSVRFRTNSDGYILPSIQHVNPHLTIAFLGGSTTECSYVAEEIRFPALVSKLMETLGLRVNTINASRSGSTVHDAINVLLNQLAKQRTDYVVLMEATNDIGVLSRDPTYNSRMALPVSSGMQAKWVTQNASNHSALVGYVRQLVTSYANASKQTVGTREQPAAPAPLLKRDVEGAYRARLEIFIATARALGSTPVLMTQPLAPYRNALTPGWVNNEQQQRFNDVIRETTARTGVQLIDLAAMTLTLPEFAAQPEKLLYDGLHATDAMSRFYAERISESFQALLSKRASEARKN